MSYERATRGWTTPDSDLSGRRWKRAALDAYGNVTEVTYGNGVATTGSFDPKKGRPTGIDTVAGGGTKIQDNAYAWRSDGLLESRASHIGGTNAKKETFAYDTLGRLKTATTKLARACADCGICGDWTDTKTVAVPPRTPGDIEGPDTSDTGDYTLGWGWSPGATSYLPAARFGARRRLDKVQLCGYDATGTGEKCLSPIDVDWTAPDDDLSAVVNRLTDSLGRKTEFEYGVLEERASHAFLFAERPFGNPPASIAGTSVLDGDDPNDTDEALKAAVTKMKRADGLVDPEDATSGWHETSYAYQGKGRKSDRRWGFLGFDATRSTDEASGVVTYRRYRMDFPHYGEVAAVYEYDGVYGASAEPMYQRVTTYAEKSVRHVGALTGQTAQTTLPRVEKVLEFHYEDGATGPLGATKTAHALSLTTAPTLHTGSPMVPDDATSTVTVYHTARAPAATWGARCRATELWTTSSARRCRSRRSRTTPPAGSG